MAVPSALASTSSRGPLPGANLHDVVPGAPGRSVTITRDAFGVPHVSAPSAEAAAYGVGYVLATDRLFETDVIRKLGQGRLSEILGPGPDDATLVTDQEMRREFYDRADIERQYRSLPPNIQRLLRAYADGFNAALLAQQANPVERSVVFTALGYEPELWRPEDSLTVLMLFTTVNLAGEGGAGELSNAALLADLVGKHGREAGLRIWNDLLLPNDPDAPAVVPRGEGPRRRRAFLLRRPPIRRRSGWHWTLAARLPPSPRTARILSPRSAKPWPDCRCPGSAVMRWRRRANGQRVGKVFCSDHPRRAFWHRRCSMRWVSKLRASRVRE